jgi:hypothetical protein
MEFSFENSLIQLLIVLLSVNLGFFVKNKSGYFFSNKENNKIENYVYQDSENSFVKYESKAKAITKEYDTLELRILKKLTLDINSEISTQDFNVLTNLTKLSKQSQRQRRHLYIKDLNLKLFIQFGERETITRKGNELDMRVKSYIINPNVDFAMLQKLVNSYESKT